MKDWSSVGTEIDAVVQRESANCLTCTSVQLERSKGEMVFTPSQIFH